MLRCPVNFSDEPDGESTSSRRGILGLASLHQCVSEKTAAFYLRPGWVKDMMLFPGCLWNYCDMIEG
jgi:hypothetical protein